MGIYLFNTSDIMHKLRAEVTLESRSPYCSEMS